MNIIEHPQQHFASLHSEIMHMLEGSVPFHLHENEQLVSVKDCLNLFVEFNKVKMQFLSEQLSEHYKCHPSEVLDRVQRDIKYLVGKKYENTDDEEEF